MQTPLAIMLVFLLAGTPLTMEVTAYTAGPESTGKNPGHPAYGLTASETRVREHHTLACPPSLAFGTWIYIPYFDGLYRCEDRGDAITEGHLDVYMRSVQEALQFGRRDLLVFILGGD